MLWGEKDMHEFLKSQGLSDKHLEDLRYRRTGRSTLQAFEILADCYRHPGYWIVVRDHHGTRQSNEYLMKTILDMVTKLGFEGFEFRKIDQSVRLNYQEPRNARSRNRL